MIWSSTATASTRLLDRWLALGTHPRRRTGTGRTGGGKTDAYLGLTAYTLAILRLQGLVGSAEEARDGTDGVAVLMRYTLRLLTAQQFQRAAALVCACEWLRRERIASGSRADRERIASGDGRWGATPFRLGLWVEVSVNNKWLDRGVLVDLGDGLAFPL